MIGHNESFVLHYYRYPSPTSIWWFMCYFTAWCYFYQRIYTKFHSTHQWCDEAFMASCNLDINTILVQINGQKQLFSSSFHDAPPHFSRADWRVLEARFTLIGQEGTTTWLALLSDLKTNLIFIYGDNWKRFCIQQCSNINFNNSEL